MWKKMMELGRKRWENGFWRMYKAERLDN